MKGQNNLDHVFFPLSKAIILIPVAVIIVALFLKTSDKLTLTSRQAFPSPTTSQAPIIVPTESTKMEIDLEGPYKCENPQSQGIFYIKNKQIYAEIIKQNQKEKALLKGDCFYMWEDFQGEKMCGVSELMSLYEAMSALGVANFDTIIGLISQSGFSTASDEAMIREVVKSCKKEEFQDSIFTVPTNVTFKESDVLKDFQPLNNQQ